MDRSSVRWSPAVAMVLLAAIPQQASAERVSMPNVKKTPTSLCVVSTMKFVRHTRKALRYQGDVYCRPFRDGDEWDVVDVESDRSRLYWRIPFAGAKPGEPDPYGKGDVFCTCRRR